MKKENKNTQSSRPKCNHVEISEEAVDSLWVEIISRYSGDSGKAIIPFINEIAQRLSQPKCNHVEISKEEVTEYLIEYHLRIGVLFDTTEMNILINKLYKHFSRPKG